MLLPLLVRRGITPSTRPTWRTLRLPLANLAAFEVHRTAMFLAMGLAAMLGYEKIGW